MATAHSELKDLLKTEKRAWRVMMSGTEADARSVYGEEGSNYLAWCASADAVRFKRQELGLV